tara:strand:- start:670 stop:960 length:291 start_codon:yes stop_codon:yes gene_type:complete
MAKGAKYVSDTSAHTGSFSSIQIAGKINGANVGGECEFTDIQWGVGLENSNDGLNTPGNPCQIHSVIASLEMSGSARIEGPIAGFKLANGSVLAYY